MTKLTALEEHCDWCGLALGTARTWVYADWRGEHLRVHPSCVTGVLKKQSKWLTDGAASIVKAAGRAALPTPEAK